jgi:uncharacterized protein
MSFLVGFIIALAVGLTGVGAGSVTAPVLILFFGLKPSESVGTALLFAAAIKLAVAPIYLARRQVNRRVLLLLCAGGIPGVIAGVAIIHALDVRRYENVLFFLLGTTIMAMALYSLYRSTRKAAESANRERLGWLPWIAGGIGAEVGFSSAGAGALGSLVLLNLTRLTAAEVVGTDMLFGLVLSVVGGGLHFSTGHYISDLLWKLIVGGLLGAFVGAGLSTIIPSRPLRIALSIWLTCLGAQLCWKALS